MVAAAPDDVNSSGDVGGGPTTARVNRWREISFLNLKYELQEHDIVLVMWIYINYTIKLQEIRKKHRTHV